VQAHVGAGIDGYVHDVEPGSSDGCGQSRVERRPIGGPVVRGSAEGSDVGQVEAVRRVEQPMVVDGRGVDDRKEREDAAAVVVDHD
ncbi:uncharacterized protein METZ01_LOCUS291791, partial [marine metagenome]